MDGGNNAILYKSDVDHSSVDSHSAGMLAYEFKRLVILEELSDKRQLDNERIKKLHGGSAEFEGRQFLLKDRRRFHWITKMILNCNNRKFPQFDWNDEALVQRLLSIHHRSKFYTDAADYELHKDDPHTFLAKDFDELIKGEWRPYMLNWLLKGLANYHSIRFSVVPAACKNWRTDLVNEQNIVLPWFNRYLVYTKNEKDYVRKVDLYKHFRDHLTGTGVKVMKESDLVISLQGIIGTRSELLPRKKFNGKYEYSVWIGWTWEHMIEE